MCGGRGGGEWSLIVYYAGRYVGLYVWRCVCVCGRGGGGGEGSLIVYYAGPYVGLYVWRCVCVYECVCVGGGGGRGEGWEGAS